jgi:hypothetical protein
MILAATWKDKIIEPHNSKIEKLKQKANKLREKGKNEKAIIIEDKINSIENKIHEAIVKRERPDLLSENAFCPTCGSDKISYIDTYDKFFCGNCQKYLDI